MSRDPYDSDTYQRFAQRQIKVGILADRDYTARQIATEIGCTINTVYNDLAAMEIRVRPARGPAVCGTTGGYAAHIGITMNPPARFRQHHAGKVWWHTVTTITLESFSSRVQLASAERAAILLERPLHNIAGNSHGRLRPEMCPACDKPSWYDPVADVYRHELSTKPIHELPRDGQTVRCYLSIVQQGVNHT